MVEHRGRYCNRSQIKAWEAWKDWQNGGSKDIYLATKRHAKKVVYSVKRKADDERFKYIRKNDHNNAIFKMTRRKRRTVSRQNQMVLLSLTLRIWLSERHTYEKLLNVNFLGTMMRYPNSGFPTTDKCLNGRCCR